MDSVSRGPRYQTLPSSSGPTPTAHAPRREHRQRDLAQVVVSVSWAWRIGESLLMLEGCAGPRRGQRVLGAFPGAGPPSSLPPRYPGGRLGETRLWVVACLFVSCGWVPWCY